jgi:hypothetical protein
MVSGSICPRTGAVIGCPVIDRQQLWEFRRLNGDVCGPRFRASHPALALGEVRTLRASIAIADSAHGD